MKTALEQNSNGKQSDYSVSIPKLVSQAKQEIHPEWISTLG